MKRAIIIVLDSVGIGELPDAAAFGDVGSNTLVNIKKVRPQTRLPNPVSYTHLDVCKRQSQVYPF